MNALNPDFAPRRAASAGPAGRIVLGIASTGRREILSRTLATLPAQDRRPDLLVLSVATPDDVEEGALAALPLPSLLRVGDRGLTRQRNRILDALRGGDILLMIDDDFLLAPDYLATLAELFAAHPDAAMLTGTVLADGIGGPGYDHEEGTRRLSAGLATPAGTRLQGVFSGYGCNFALRADPVLAHGLRFDEALPLHGWLEDVDFSRQLAPHGRILKADGLRGVHLGTRAGRTPGLRLGYSQVANPVYLIRKRRGCLVKALDMIARNLAANLWYTLRPRPWVDHRGRLRGNLRALADLVRGRLHPGRVLDLPR